MIKAIKQTSINSIVLLLLIAASGVYPEQFDVTTEATCKSSLDPSLSAATKTNICKGIQLRSLAKTGCTGRLSNGRCKPQDSEGLSTTSHTSKLPPPGLMTSSDLANIIRTGSYNSGGVLAGNDYRAYVSGGKVKISKKENGTWKSMCTIEPPLGTCEENYHTFTPTIAGLLVSEATFSRKCRRYVPLGMYNTQCGEWSTVVTRHEEKSFLWEN